MFVSLNAGGTGGELAHGHSHGRGVEPRRSAMEDVIREALSMDRLLPTPDRMRALTTRLLAFVGAAATALEEDVNDLPMDDPVRRDALAVVKEARYRRGIGPGDGYGSAMAFTRSLGQAADALVRQRRRINPGPA